MLCLSSWLYADTREKKEMVQMESLAQSTGEQTGNKDELGRLSAEVDRSNPTLEIALTKDNMTVWT